MNKNRIIDSEEMPTSRRPREHDCERIQDPVKRTLCKAQGPPPLDCNNVKDPILKGICRTKGLDGGESSSSTEL